MNDTLKDINNRQLRSVSHEHINQRTVYTLWGAIRADNWYGIFRVEAKKSLL